MVLHTAVAVTGRQLDELRRLGAEIVVTTATPALAGQAPGSLVQAWVPARRIADMEILPWVSAVTAPAYARTDG